MIGIFSKTIDPGIVESAGYGGLDFIILDQEHGNVPFHILENLVRAAKIAGITSIVRVNELNANYIASALDVGADGIQVPNISTPEQAKEAIKAAKFHPDGERGVCRFVPAANYGTMNKTSYFTESNKKQVILQVEGGEGVNRIEEIIKVKGIDVLFIGPYDLSQSLGVPGEVTHPKVLKVLSEISEKSKEIGIRLGTFCDNQESAKLMKELGFTYIAYSVDMNIFSNACNSLVQILK
jgi:4-hydroxy-2-oxoheptanedioate aldolase